MDGKNIPYIIRGREVVGEQPIRIALQGDNRTNRVTFHIDRVYNGVDLGAFTAQIIVVGDMLPEPHTQDLIEEGAALTRTVTSGRITLVWTVGANQAYTAGKGAAQIRLISENAEVWHSEKFALTVDASLDADEAIAEQSPSVIIEHTAKLMTLTETVDALGTAAFNDIGIASGDIPVIGEDGKLDISLFPSAISGLFLLGANITGTAPAVDQVRDRQFGSFSRVPRQGEMYYAVYRGSVVLLGKMWICIEEVESIAGEGDNQVAWCKTRNVYELTGGSGGSTAVGTELLYLTTEDWEEVDEHYEQSIPVQLNTALRNVIDWELDSVVEAGECGVVAVGENWSSISFKATEIPSKPLGFRVVSMEVEYAS